LRVTMLWAGRGNIIQEVGLVNKFRPGKQQTISVLELLNHV